MVTRFTENLFSTTYKDDYRDSDNYYRILFNSGKALQARELTQLQTIIQKEIERFGRNIFKEGAAVNPGGPTINTRYEFIKLNTTANVLPEDLTTIIGDEFEGQDSTFKFVVLEVVAAIFLIIGYPALLQSSCYQRIEWLQFIHDFNGNFFIKNKIFCIVGWKCGLMFSYCFINFIIAWKCLV